MTEQEWLGLKLGLPEPLRIFPVNPATKAPLISTAEGGRGFHDASRDREVLKRWRCRFPRALFATPTGVEAGFVVLDIDVSGELSGWDALEEIGVMTVPETLMSLTPRGGTHCWFRHPGPGTYIKTIAGRLGRGLDIRGDGGSVILPYGPGRQWDPHYGPNTPLAGMPSWMEIAKPTEPLRHETRLPRVGRLTPYGECALDHALRAILSAGTGEQRDTLNRESYGIGQLVAGGEIPPDLALSELCWAADRIRTLDPRRPWRPGECRKVLKAAFVDGQAAPRCAE